jgi:hypothetical protein
MRAQTSTEHTGCDQSCALCSFVLQLLPCAVPTVTTTTCITSTASTTDLECVNRRYAATAT